MKPYYPSALLALYVAVDLYALTVNAQCNSDFDPYKRTRIFLHRTKSHTKTPSPNMPLLWCLSVSGLLVLISRAACAPMIV